VLEHSLCERLQVVFEGRHAAARKILLDRVVAFRDRVQEVRVGRAPMALLGELVPDPQVPAHDQQRKGVKLVRAQVAGARLTAFAALAAGRSKQQLRMRGLPRRMQSRARAVRQGAGNRDAARAGEYACTDAKPDASPEHEL